jgi:hypothetical protein
VLDRRGLTGPAGIGADVEHLVAHERSHVEPLVVDRQQHEPGLELTRAHALDDRRGVAADQPQRDVRVRAQERRHELLEAPGQRPAEDPDADRARPQ